MPCRLIKHSCLRKRLMVFGCCLALPLIAAAQSGLPKSGADYFRAGLAAQEAHRFEEALEMYAAALRLDPKSFGAQFNSGTCYLALQKFENAVTALKAASALKPEEPHVQFALGQA